MNLRALLLGTLFSLSAAMVMLPAATVTMSLDEVRAGMVGTGLTVFQGTQRSEFAAEIMGVLENSTGVSQNLILARLTGGPLDESGVIQGMSGSPVYIDGRLIGAVSYAMGSFSKDTIAGLTPIGEMLRDDSGRPTGLASIAPKLPLPLGSDSWTAVLANHLRPLTPFATHPDDVRGTGALPAPAGAIGVQLRPIGTPLVMTGFETGAVDRIAPLFRPGGLVPVVGGALSNQITTNRSLEAGDAIGVSLIRGDFSMAGTGTVTLVDEGRVYAFGHPFYNLGKAQFPMTRAYIHGVLPSLSISSKISAVGDVIGTIDQDRSTGISGSFGAGPRMVPLRVTLEAPDRNRVDSFELEVVADDFFTPMLAYNALLNALIGHSRQLGAATYVVNGVVRLVGREAVSFGETFSGDSASVLAALYISGPLTALLNNGFESVAVDAIDVEVTAHDDVRIATIDRAWLDDAEPRPGRTVPLRIVFRTHRGAEIDRTVAVELPSNARGRLQLLIADGTTLARQERQESGQGLQATDLNQLIRAMNEARRNNQVYVQLRRADEGAVMAGRRMPSLPPSVLEVLGANRSGPGFTRLRNTSIGEWSISLDHVISGSRVLTLDLDNP